MADIRAAREKPIEQFYEAVENVHAGMLGLDGSKLQMQPMAPQLDRAAKTIWFFARTDAEIVEETGPGARAHFVVIGRNHDYHASVSGPIEIRKEREVIDRYWSRITEAWFEGGKDDPKLTVLALRLEDGEAWVSTDSSLKFGWEIARANLSVEHDPEIGMKVPLKF